MLFIDYVIIFIIVISSLLGIFRGFIKELLAIISWVLAFYFSSILSDSVSKFIPFDFDDSLKYFIAYLLIFVFVLIIASILIKLLNKFVKTVGLTLTNVLMGSIFGLIRGVLIAFLLILVAENFRFIDKETLSKSLLVPMIKEYVEKSKIDNLVLKLNKHLIPISFDRNTVWFESPKVCLDDKYSLFDISKGLNIPLEYLDTDLPIQKISAGISVLMIPIKNGNFLSSIEMFGK